MGKARSRSRTLASPAPARRTPDPECAVEVDGRGARQILGSGAGPEAETPLQAEIVGGEACEVGEGIPAERMQAVGLGSGGRRCAQGGQLLEQPGHLANHHRPVEGLPGPGPPCGAHSPPQVGISGQFGDRLRSPAHMDGCVLGHGADERLIGVETNDVADGEGLAEGSRRAAEGRDEKALVSVPDGEAIAVPVARHHRKTRRHRLEGRDPEGLLDVVDQGKKDVPCGPQVGDDLRIIAVLEVHLDGRGIGCGGLLVSSAVRLAARKPARQGEVHAPPRQPSRLLNGAEHGLGKGLLEKGQPAHPDNEHLVALYAEVGADPCARARTIRLLPDRLGRNAKGDDGQLRLRPPLAAEPLSEKIAPAVEHALDGVPHGRRGTDHGVPGLNRSGQGAGDHLPHRRRSEGVDEAHQAVSPVSHGLATDPGKGVELRLPPEQHAAFGGRFRGQDAAPGQLARRAPLGKQV